MVDPKIADHKGPHRQVTTGDGLLVAFASCRRRAQMRRPKCRRQWPKAMPQHRRTQRIEFRIGINVATSSSKTATFWRRCGQRPPPALEGLAEPGGICVSGPAFRRMAVGRLDLAFDDMGEAALKNISRPVRVLPCRDGYPPAIRAKRVPAPPLPRQSRRIAVLAPFANMSGDRRAGIFRRRHGRGDHHRALPHPLALRDRPPIRALRLTRVQGGGRSIVENRSAASSASVMCSKARFAKAAGRPVRITAQTDRWQLSGAHLVGRPL